MYCLCDENGQATKILDKMVKNRFRLGMVLIGMFAMLLSACSDDDKTVSVTYSMGFENVQSSSISDLSVIENAYKNALGVDNTTFVLEGTIEECDQKVVETCRNVENTLKTQTWSGSYTFEVNNQNSGKTIYSVVIE